MKSFTKNNQSFVCEHCGHQTPKHPSSSRDHCNECLWGKHVDMMTGDRLNQCQGLLEPVGLETKNQKQTLIYHCNKCTTQIRNIVAPDDKFEKLLQVSNLKW
jgi:hypothetical protein